MSDPSLATRALAAFGSVGVRNVFGLPGVHNLAFWRVEDPECPRIVGVRHEQATVYAADGAARASGGLGVALTTTGPGAANAVGAFGEAAASGSPVLLLATEVPTTLRRDGDPRGALHESRDQGALFAPLAKRVYTPRSVEDAVRELGEAVACALRFPRGPVYLDIPADLLDRRAPEVQVRLPAAVGGRAEEVAALAAFLDRSERIVIWAGGGVVQSGAEDELVRLAERLSSPVVETFAARGTMPLGHGLRVGAPPHEPEVARLIEDADALLAIGTGFDAMTTRNWRMPRPPGLAVVNADPGALERNFPAEVAVEGDAKAVLGALLDLVRRHDPSHGDIGEIATALRARLRADERTTSAVDLVADIEAELPGDGVLVADMSIIGYWTAGYAHVDGTRRVQYPVGWGTLGYALPASIGPASEGIATIVVAGDGAVMMSLGELATLREHDLPVTLVLVDDAGYGMLRFDQAGRASARGGVDLVTPDFLALGAAFGIPAVAVDGEGTAFRRALRDAVGARSPRIIVVPKRLFPPRTTSPRWFE